MKNQSLLLSLKLKHLIKMRNKMLIPKKKTNNAASVENITKGKCGNLQNVITFAVCRVGRAGLRGT